MFIKNINNMLNLIGIAQLCEDEAVKARVKSLLETHGGSPFRRKQHKCLTTGKQCTNSLSHASFLNTHVLKHSAENHA